MNNFCPAIHLVGLKLAGIRPAPVNPTLPDKNNQPTVRYENIPNTKTLIGLAG